MPLAYDDVPGSWGVYSKDWPYIEDPQGEVRRKVIEEKLVPYGSYVTVGDHLRLETQEYVEKVRAALATPAGEGEFGPITDADLDAAREPIRTKPTTPAGGGVYDSDILPPARLPAWNSAATETPAGGGGDSVYARLRSIRYNATHGSQDRPMHERLRLIAEDAERAIAASERRVAYQHPDDAAVDRFAAAMKAKLADARAKGRCGWENKDDCSQQRLSNMLRTHVEKGDPRDVANFCMFLHQRGEAILPYSGED